LTNPPKRRRPVDAIMADIEQAGEAAADLIGRGKEEWDANFLLRLAGEAVIGRIAEAAHRLPDEVKSSLADVPWDDMRDIRILVDHIYHRIDYDTLWETLRTDVPHLLSSLRGWKDTG
jgi:uncharacterized protein with HEPN domain